MKFYDGNKLLNMKDINGVRPQLFIATTNRGPGKTTFFAKYCLDNYRKILVLCRYAYELDECGASFLKGALIFNKWKDCVITEKNLVRNSIKALYLEKAEDSDVEPQHVGYCVSVNNADIIKKKRYLLQDVDAIVFDEFQSEDDSYCFDEVRKFLSIVSTVSTNWTNDKYIPVFMLSNQVSVINPYFRALNIEPNGKTKFYRGNGWVMEDSYYEDVSRETLKKPIFQAFEKTNYVSYLRDKSSYLNNYYGLVRKISTKDYKLYFNLKGKEGIVGVWLNSDSCYISSLYNSNTTTYSVNLEEEIKSIKSEIHLVQMLKRYYLQGKIIFENQLCRKIFIDIY